MGAACRWVIEQCRVVHEAVQGGSWSSAGWVIEQCSVGHAWGQEGCKRYSATTRTRV